MIVRICRLYNVLLAFFVVLSSPSVSLSEEQLAGLWVSAVRGNGVSQLLEYTSNAKMISSMAVMFDFSYEMEGSKLIMTSMEEGEDAESTTYNIKSAKHRIVMSSVSSNEEIVLDKVNSSGGDLGENAGSLIGKWKFEYSSGVTGYYLFTKDGIAMLRIPMPGRTVSNYAVHGNTIKITRDDEVSGTMKFRFENKFLVLESEDGKRYNYRRVVDKKQ